ncbi:MAG: acyl-CoA reductase [Bacteroidales bacterium]|nr:acyl-CoA reductase [Bacteroidales bacterium]
MIVSERIKILSELGNNFAQVCKNNSFKNFPGFNKIEIHNPWFIEDNVKFALKEWSKLLKPEILNEWLSAYQIPDKNNKNIKLGIISAGNIPLVGLHDLICGFICGAQLKVKLSSKDNILMKWVIDIINNSIIDQSDKIITTEERLKDFDAIIATGSNNTNRYFEYYFGDYPKILRHNRNSVAIITGNETKQELELLADDVFRYFGLGCRNVSALFVPKDYNFDLMGQAFQKYLSLADNNKYANNLIYQYTIISMNQMVHINFGNCLLVENSNLYSPISVLHYNYYKNTNDVNTLLAHNRENIQCIVSINDKIKKSIQPGQTQQPKLNEYADNIDTIKFLLNLQL